MSYFIEIKKSAQKSLDRIPQLYQRKIIERIYALTEEPLPDGCKKLTGRDAWRIRVGNYRVIYEVNDRKLIILVVQIGHRKEIYR